MSGVTTQQVTADEDGLRLDRWFRRRFPALGHGALEKLLRTGQIRVNGARVKAGDRVAPGDAVRVPPLDLTAPPAAPAADRRLDDKTLALVVALKAAVIHKDDAVMVLNKPAGLAVQGGSGVTVHLDGLLPLLKFGAAETPRLVHRLDKDTSGVIVLARTRAAAAALTKAFRARDAKKTYWALTIGVPRPARGKIDLALAKEGPEGHEKMRGVRNDEDHDEAKRAVTFYAVIEALAGKVAWLAMRPLTGRTHQLRAHAAAMGTPIVGDGKYGGADAFLTGTVSRKLHLHARSIDIAHPRGGRLTAHAALPSHMAESWALFGFDPEAAADPFAALDE